MSTIEIDHFYSEPKNQSSYASIQWRTYGMSLMFLKVVVSVRRVYSPGSKATHRQQRMVSQIPQYPKKVRCQLGLHKDYQIIIRVSSRVTTSESRVLHPFPCRGAQMTKMRWVAIHHKIGKRISKPPTESKPIPNGRYKTQGERHDGCECIPTS